MSHACSFRDGCSAGPEAPARRVLQGATYTNGRPYSPARGRDAPRRSVEDYLAAEMAVIDLPRERPTAAEFLRKIVRELKIRCYKRSRNCWGISGWRRRRFTRG
jgi:hypothetical protein